MVRKRYYHYPSPIAIDRFNTRVLKALATKLSRDYAGFFVSLVKTYQRGEQKKKLDYTVALVKKSIVLLENMVSMNQVSRSDVSNLVGYIEEINVSRDEFLVQAEQNKSLEAKMQKVSETTGISPEDLNVTKEIVTRGAAQTRRRTKEGALPFIKRTMPGTLALGGELGRGITTAALGPFAPVAGMLGTLAKGAWGMGAGVREARQLKQEEKLTGRLAPMASNLQTSAFNRLATKRAEHPFGASFAGISQRTPIPRRQNKEEMVFPLTYFFDKKAHKTKWTKELLDRFKGIEKKLDRSKTDKGLSGMLGLGGLVKKFSLLGAAILPLLGPTGVLLGLGAAGVFAGLKFKELAFLTGEYWGVLKNVKIHEEKQLELQKKFQEREAGTLAKKMITAKTSEERGTLAAQLRINQKEREKALIKKGRIRITESGGFGRAWETWKSGAGSLLGIGDTEAPVSKIPGATQKEEQLEAMPAVKGPFIRSSKEKDAGMVGIQKAIENLHETVSRQQDSGVRGASLGSHFGVGDPIITNWSSGQVTVENI